LKQRERADKVYDWWSNSILDEHEQKQWFWPLTAIIAIIEKQWGINEQLFLWWSSSETLI
jgi:hypothetical protein